MQEIKFKVLQKLFKQWIDLKKIVFADDDNSIIGIIDKDGEPYGVKEVKLLQFTGLKDRGGKEIYEGDIVDCSRYNGEEIYRVVIKDIRNLPLEMFGSNLDFLTLTGNVFENKDMLPKQTYENIIRSFEDETILCTHENTSTPK